MHFNSSEDRLLAKNDMPGPGSYEPKSEFMESDEVLLIGKKPKGISIGKD